MKRIHNFFLLVILVAICSCTTTERIVFNENGSGNYYMKFDMSKVMEVMNSSFEEAGFEESESEDDLSKKVIDTTMTFKDIMVQYKDSIAALPEDKRAAIEAVKDMYITMRNDESKGIFDFGVGMEFSSIEDLKGIQDKVNKAKMLNDQGGQAEAMREGSPAGKFMDDENIDVSYSFENNVFRRTTTFLEGYESFEMEEEAPSEEEDEEMIGYFKSANYIITYTFVKPIKSTTIENAELSKDRKTITYKASWMDYLRNPKSMDISITFDE